MGRYMPVLAHRGDIEPQLAETIDKVLQLDPDERFQNAAEMRHFLTRPYLQVAPPSRWPRRLAASGVILLGLALIGLKPLLQRQTPVAPLVSASRAATPQAAASAVVAAPAQPGQAVPSLREVEPQPTWSLRETVQTVDQLNGAFLRLFQGVQAFATSHSVTGTAFVRYHTWDPPRQIDLEEGILLVTPRSAEGGKVKAGELPGGRVAVLTHLGGYDKLPERFVELDSWVRRQKLKPAPGPWAIYRISAATEPRPERWQTDLYCPILP